MTGLPEQLIMPCPFAGGSGAALATIPGDVTEDEVNFTQGFPDVYSAPKSNGGKFVKRSELNAIGNMGTKNDFYRMCGGINTFNPAFCTAVGGYPKGAVLDYFNGVDFLKVLSLVDNNTHDFCQGNFGTSWMLLNQGEQAISRVKIVDMKNVIVPGGYVASASMIYGFFMPISGFVSFEVSNYSFSVKNLGSVSSSSGLSKGSGILAKSFAAGAVIDTPVGILPGTAGMTYNNYKLQPGLPTAQEVVLTSGYGTVRPDVGLIAAEKGEQVLVYVQNGTQGYDSEGSFCYDITFDLSITVG